MCDTTTPDNTNHEIPTGISQKAFNYLRKEYGEHSSWAIWRVPKNSDALTTNEEVGNPDVFKDNEQPWKWLRPQFVFVGLNPSIKSSEHLSMFHSSRGNANDHKLRFALYKTAFWGGYCTDVFPETIEGNGGIVWKEFKRQCKNEPDTARCRLTAFLSELEEVERISGLVQKPLLIAMGKLVYNVLTLAVKKGFLDDSYHIERIPHYSDRFRYRNPVNYRKKVWEELGIRDVRTSQDCHPMAAPDMGSLHAGQSRRRPQATVANTRSTSGQKIKEQTTRGQNAAPPSPLRRQYYDFWKSFQKWGRNNSKPWSNREPSRDGRSYFNTSSIQTTFGPLHLRFTIGDESGKPRVSTEIYCEESQDQRTSVAAHLNGAFDEAFGKSSQVVQDLNGRTIRFIRQADWRNADDTLFARMAADYDIIREILRTIEA